MNVKDENTAFVIFNKLPQTLLGFLEFLTPQIADQGVGISKEDQTILISVYPNPNSGAFTIEIDNPQQYEIEITFLNAIGQQLYNETLPAFLSSMIIKDFKIDDIATGMYVLKVSTAKKTWLKKIVILNLY